VTNTDPSYQDIAVDHPGPGVLRVAIDRPEVRGAYRNQTCRELVDVLDRFAADDGGPGCFRVRWGSTAPCA
jgi:1,4-dihydroxy-2-naphthoyl-CoA synthase